MAGYDASVIVIFADKLYAQAERLGTVYTFVGVLVGGALGLAIGSMFGNGWIFAIVGAAFVGSLAFAAAQEKAFTLRLQAQTALCQVQIELNTRSQRDR